MRFLKGKLSALGFRFYFISKAYFSRQQFLAEAVLHLMLYGPSERPRAVHGIKSVPGKLLYCALLERQIYTTLTKPIGHPL